MYNATVICHCPFCGERNIVTVKAEDYYRWKDEGELIQNAFPYLSADDRERIKTGICPACWEKMFPSEDENEDNEEEEDYDYEEYDYDFDFGFDPYTGCYTGDC